MTEDRDENAEPTTGRHPIAIPIEKPQARPWPGRRLALVVALLVLAVGLIALGIKLIDSDDEDDQPPADDLPTALFVPGKSLQPWTVTRGAFAGQMTMTSTRPSRAEKSAPLRV